MKKIQGAYFGRRGIYFASSQSRGYPTTVKTKEIEGDFGKGKIAQWGEGNRYPQGFLDELKLNGAAAGGLSLLKSAHYGSGLIFYKNELDDNGKRNRVLQYKEDYPPINDFFKRNKFEKFLIETISDLETFNMAFPEFILSKDFNKITHVHRQKTAWCRRELINPKTGFSQNVYLNANWEDSQTKSQYVSRIPCVSAYWTCEEIREYCKRKKILKFVMPIHYPMMDESYYNKTSWHAIYHNGWMEVSNSIPKYKKHLFENQVNIKYVIYISDQYFEDEYGDDWEEFKVETRQTKKEELITAIDDHLSGNESSGRSLYSKKIKTPDGDWVKGIEIEPIDNKIKDGSYLPDASAANSEILFSMGVDPSLIGAGIPGGKLGAGSGSDKREAFMILSALFKTKRQTTLEIWDFLKSYNSWDEDLQARFENTTLTTLDKNPTGQISTIQ